MASLYRSLPLLLQLLAILPVLAEVRCRYNATAPPMVSYYTCTELATKYETSLEKFFLLNPLLDPDCTSIQAGKQYCVSGNVVPTSSDGTCKADSGKSCLGYPGGQCCNSQTWKCGNTKADCAAGTCAGGLCAVNDPSAYSLDGKCGSATGDKKCGGKWGDCCGKSTSTCGTESDFCGTGNCQYGNCTFTPPTAAPGGASPLPFYYYGNTTDGLCGPANDNKVCNVAWGFCCASTGKCGMGAGFCGTGCMPGYGNCTVAVVAPTPKPGDVSPDGTCGGQNGFVCKGSPQGDCCSSFGFCGSTDGHCKAGCQSKFGTCTGGNVSPDGSCGGTTGYTCVGSTFGTCCSKYGSCGTTTDHCQAGCQSQFGTCTGNSKVSPDGSCGGTNGYTCAGGIFGNCCSKYGSCGSTTDHCSTGCQSTFGTCSGGSKISPDASCGGSNGYTCKGSAFGDCCSASGYCGSTTAFCSAGCQASFGTCPTGSDKISTVGNCGGSKGQTCMGSTFGNCCSSFGSCGSTTGHCTTGCQSAFGLCTTSGTNPGGVSPDSTCGGSKKYTCAKSAFGGCCSSTGSCGSTVNHCAQGCQTSFSNSCMTGKIPTLDGSCGPKNSGMTCATGPFNGQCCGASGFCGTTSAHCGTGCNAGYGKCN